MSGEKTVEIIEGVVVELMGECNRYANGVCQTAACLRRGGHVRGTRPDYSKATCDRHEQVRALEAMLLKQKGCQ